MDFLCLFTQFDIVKRQGLEHLLVYVDHGSSDFTLFDCLVLEMVLFRLSVLVTSS